MGHTILGDLTSIKVKKITRDRLAGFGNKKDTYDDILNHLMDSHQKSRKRK